MKAIKRVKPAELAALPDMPAKQERSNVVVLPERDVYPELEPLDDSLLLSPAPLKKRKAERVRAEFRPMPDFAPFFNMGTPLPWKRNKAFSGYCLDVSNEDYQAFPAVNAGLLDNATQAEMHHYMTEPPSDKYSNEGAADAFTTGTLLHWAVLEPWKFDAEHIHDHMDFSDTQGLATEANRERRLEDPRLIVTQKHLDKAFRCRDAVIAHPRALELLGDLSPSGRVEGEYTTEASGIVWDQINGLWRKIRVDLLRPGVSKPLVDVKTTAFPLERFEREAIKNGYLGQAAWYMDTHALLTGERRNWVWVVVTKFEPFMCRLFWMVNRPPDDPLYQESKLKYTRELLGLDDSLRLGRLFMWRDAAIQTLDLRERGMEGDLHPSTVRSIWAGYEQENRDPEIY